MIRWRRRMQIRLLLRLVTVEPGYFALLVDLRMQEHTYNILPAVASRNPRAER